MKIRFFPQRRDDDLTIARRGDVLILNGEEFDFSGVEESHPVPADIAGSPWLADTIRRLDGQLNIALFMPHGANAPEARKYPQPVTLMSDGPLLLPPHSIPADSEENPDG